jgi:hypothetical protein
MHELVFKSGGTTYEMILLSGSPDADITYGYKYSRFCKRNISIHKFQQITCRDDYTFNLFFPLLVINELILKSRETTNVCKGYVISNFKLWLFTKAFAITY